MSVLRSGFCLGRSLSVWQVHAARARERRAEERAARGEWGSTEPDGAPDAGARAVGAGLGVGAVVVEQIRALGGDYAAAFAHLLRCLHARAGAGGPGAESLRFLTFRLDFNEFYANAGGAVAAPGAVQYHHV